VVSGHHQKRGAQRSEVPLGDLVFVAPSAVRQVATGDNKLRAQDLDKTADFPLESWIIKAVSRAEMQVGHVKDA
jgi:hypothetical protein